MEYFFNYFGEDSYRYFVIFFIGKERIDFEGKSLEKYFEMVLLQLKLYVEKCENRVIVFNNLLKDGDGIKQV